MTTKLIFKLTVPTPLKSLLTQDLNISVPQTRKMRGEEYSNTPVKISTDGEDRFTRSRFEDLPNKTATPDFKAKKLGQPRQTIRERRQKTQLIKAFEREQKKFEEEQKELRGNTVSLG